MTFQAEWLRITLLATSLAFTMAGPVLADSTVSPNTKPAEFKVTDFLLDNGMEVVVIPDHRAPFVTHMVWY